MCSIDDYQILNDLSMRLFPRALVIYTTIVKILTFLLKR